MVLFIQSVNFYFFGVAIKHSHLTAPARIEFLARIDNSNLCSLLLDEKQMIILYYFTILKW